MKHADCFKIQIQVSLYFSIYVLYCIRIYLFMVVTSGFWDCCMFALHCPVVHICRIFSLLDLPFTFLIFLMSIFHVLYTSDFQ